jgi:hypothetical protein
MEAHTTLRNNMYVRFDLNCLKQNNIHLGIFWKFEVLGFQNYIFI